MSAVLALCIGMIAGSGAPGPGWIADSPVLAPHGDLSPTDRRTSGKRVDDYETVGNLPPGTVMIERRIIIHIPVLPVVPMMEGPAFVERAPPVPTQKRPACLALRTIRGANVQSRSGVVFVTTANARYQAALERGCRPIDFQSGFYLDPSDDGALCAGRDIIQARSGARCTITGLKHVKSGD